MTSPRMALPPFGHAALPRSAMAGATSMGTGRMHAVAPVAQAMPKHPYAEGSPVTQPQSHPFTHPGAPCLMVAPKQPGIVTGAVLYA